MPKRNTPTPPPAALMQDAMGNYLYWLRWWEMMVASGLTIGLRLSGISYKLQKNQLPDLREMWRMGEEKNTATWQSLAAIPTMADWWSAGQRQQQKHQKQPQKHQKSQQPSPQQSPQDMLDAMFQLWRPFYSASTANAFRLSGTRKPRTRR